MKKIDAESLAKFLAGELQWKTATENFEITGFAPLKEANQNQISFFTGKTVTGELRSASAGLLLVASDFVGEPEVGALLRVKNPYAAMVRAVKFLYEENFSETKIAASAKIHPSAVVEGIVGEKAEIGPGSVVMRGAEIGAGTILQANVTIYPNVKIGENCIFQAGAVVGSRGFGFYVAEDGERKMVPHVSGVRIGNRSEFGANSVVAAGFLAPTKIGDDCHFDSFVQIGHNCEVGNRVYMASQSGLGGTTVVEDDCEFAGGAQIAGHLTIGRGAVIAAKAGVTKSIPAGAVYAGLPAEPIEKWRKGIVCVRKLSR